MQLVFANLLGSEFLRRAVKVPRVARDVFQIGLLRLLGEIANAHVFEHPPA